MNDLISRAALLEEVDSYIAHTSEQNAEHYVCKRVKKIIENVPTIDAKPVVHGVWIEQYGNLGKLYTEFVCSKCKMIYTKTHNYCPNCGARMDGE